MTDISETTTRQVARRVFQHKAEYVKLPTGTFTVNDTDVDISKKALHRGIEAGILRKEDRIHVGRGDMRNVYRVNKNARELLDNYESAHSDTICPCDCIQGGINNPKDEKGYYCPHCGEHFTRAELNE